MTERTGSCLWGRVAGLRVSGEPPTCRGCRCRDGRQLSAGGTFDATCPAAATIEVHGTP